MAGYIARRSESVEWQSPVVARSYRGNVGSLGYMGSATALDIEALGLFADENHAYVVSTANGAGALATATVGDVWEYDGAAWVRLAVGVGGFVSADVALVANSSGVLVAPLTNGADEEKLCKFDGTSNTPASKTSGASGDSLTISPGAAKGGRSYVYSGGWTSMLAPVGGYVPAGTRFIVHASLVVSPLTTSDFGKLAEFTGSSATPILTTPEDGWALVIRGESNPDEGTAWLFDGAVPTGTWGQFVATDTAAIHDNVAGEIAAITAKATPVDGDYLVIEDSAAGNVKKSITIGSLPAGGGVLSTGTYAASAATPTAGSIRDITGGPIQRRCYVAGTWVDYLPGVGPVTLPVVADWATTLQGGLSLAAVNGGHARAVIAGGSGAYLLRAQLKAHTGPKGYRIHFDAALAQNDATFGLAFRRVASDREWTCTIGREMLVTYNWVGGALPGGVLDQFQCYRAITWLEIIDNGATMTCNVGSDLGNRLATNIFSQAYAVHLGGAPDLVGLCGWSLDRDSLASIYHISEFVP